jgi:hypothetical protein
MSTPQINIEYFLAEFQDYTETELLTVLRRMAERHVPLELENIQHALDGEDIRKSLVKDLGMVLSDDGRRNEVSPTSDRRGKVTLTFAQAKRLIDRALAN